MFGLEKIQENPGIVNFILRSDYIDEFLSDEYKSKGEREKSLLKYEINEKFNEKVAGEFFSEEEWICFLKDGFLGVLRMKCPELGQNEVFNFLISLNCAIQELETELQGKSYTEVLASIQTRLGDKDSNDSNVWKAVKLCYDKYTFWVSDKSTGNGGKREEYLKFLELKSKGKVLSEDGQEQKSEADIIVEEFLKVRGFLTLEECLQIYGVSNLKTLEELLEFCRVEEQEGYKVPNQEGGTNYTCLDELMWLYYKIKGSCEKEHTATEVVEGIRDIGEFAVEDALNAFTGAKTNNNNSSRHNNNVPAIGE